MELTSCHIGEIMNKWKIVKNDNNNFVIEIYTPDKSLIINIIVM